MTSAGAYHTALLLEGGRARAFGSNTDGECDVPEELQGHV
eukprot:CAMPEP_0195085470 /NCGR_PEP_ID=MMETSP0448-20130528/25881_1 /TAXON_ID=66468 /ORGANISM="Heterocapsa triquestra, Strain CCMP 448" /LENGTH=39 /DNA_ID= /DNA_START= /DNA_END= /DNA_ORIENTATION=